jgi:hypothetical protein
MKELLEAASPVRSMPSLYNEVQLLLRLIRDSLQVDSKLRVAVVRSEKLVAEAGDSSGTQRKALPSSAVKNVTENTGLCVTVICEV